MKEVRCVTIVAALFTAVSLAGSANADVVYDVGPSETFTTIKQAVDFITSDANVPGPLTENHIIRVQAGTYTDFLNLNHSGASRTSKDKRFIIEAVPGDDVIIQNQFVVKESHVTIRGFKFEGLPLLATGEYIVLFSVGAPAGTYHGGLIIHDNEFEGRKAMESVTAGRLVPEPGVDFDFAMVNNFIHDFEIFAQQPGGGSELQLVAGNVYADWNLSGTSANGRPFAPSAPAGYQTRYYLNNTAYTFNGRMQGGFYIAPGAGVFTNVVFANNILMQEVASPFASLDAGMGEANHGVGGTVPRHAQMSDNIQFGAQKWAWHYVNTPFGMTTLADWNAHLAVSGEAETGSQYADPLFADQANQDFQLESGSPAVNGCTGGGIQAGIDALDIGDLLDYSNPVRDIGYQPLDGAVHIGALGVACDCAPAILAAILAELCDTVVTPPTSVAGLEQAIRDAATAIGECPDCAADVIATL